MSTSETRPARPSRSAARPSPPTVGPRAGLSELVVPGILVAIAIFLIVGTVNMKLPPSVQVPGPTFFPMIIIGLLLLMAVLSTVQILRSHARAMRERRIRRCAPIAGTARVRRRRCLDGVPAGRRPGTGRGRRAGRRDPARRAAKEKAQGKRAKARRNVAKPKPEPAASVPRRWPKPPGESHASRARPTSRARPASPASDARRTAPSARGSLADRDDRGALRDVGVVHAERVVAARVDRERDLRARAQARRERRADLVGRVLAGLKPAWIDVRRVHRREVDGCEIEVQGRARRARPRGCAGGTSR